MRVKNGHWITGSVKLGLIQVVVLTLRKRWNEMETNKRYPWRNKNTFFRLVSALQIPFFEIVKFCRPSCQAKIPSSNQTCHARFETRPEARLYPGGLFSFQWGPGDGSDGNPDGGRFGFWRKAQRRLGFVVAPPAFSQEAVASLDTFTLTSWSGLPPNLAMVVKKMAKKISRSDYSFMDGVANLYNRVRSTSLPPPQITLRKLQQKQYEEVYSNGAPSSTRAKSGLPFSLANIFCYNCLPWCLATLNCNVIPRDTPGGNREGGNWERRTSLA